MRTLEGLLKEGVRILEAADIEEARLDAWLLLEYTSGKSRAYYYAHPEEETDRETEERYFALCRKRAEHIPLQHLTHSANFMGYDFYVNGDVLVPRQDTEILVEEALKILKPADSPRILDMCTGSGCILISLLMEKPGAEGTGADVSAAALAVAGKNAARLGAGDRAVFVESDLFSGEFFQQKSGTDGEKYDMLISNPPYIPTAEIRELMDEVRFHDPVLALDGREDGLWFYRKITEAAPSFLKEGGWLLYEIGCSQGPQVEDILRNSGFINVRTVKDLSGLDRVTLGQRSDRIMREEQNV